jgi:glycosyltransferase involved in cell wall biosynthesis
LISVFTPTHRGMPIIDDAYKSLLAQTYTDWEWVVAPNNGALLSEEMSRDARVRIIPYTQEGDTFSIGALKHFCCDHATGDIYLELDDDDVLGPDCLAKIALAFEDPVVQFAYGNCCEYRWPEIKPVTYSSYWGWSNRDCTFMGMALIEARAWPMGPWPLRQIYWSPNHPRSWRASAYNALGGHDPKLALVDDHDLNIRTYLAYGARGMRLIDKPVYGYRMLGDSTCKSHSKDILKSNRECYWKYVEPMFVRWAHDEGLRLLNLGGALGKRRGYETVDIRDGADVQCDLEKDWPFATSSVGVVYASHVFEHLHDPIHTMNELFRVLAPGGFAMIAVPSTDGRGAWQDPTHCSWWNENSFWYYTRTSHAAYIQPRYKGRFQVSHLSTGFPNQNFRDNNIPVVTAHLIALKPGYEERRAGEILI